MVVLVEWLLESVNVLPKESGGACGPTTQRHASHHLMHGVVWCGEAGEGWGVRG